MKKLIITVAIIFSISATAAMAGQRAIKITKPKNGATLHSPVTVCLSATGVKPIHADGTMVDGEGHHHVLIDRELPKLGKPMGKWKSIKHIGSGDSCTEIALEPGEHTLTGLFGYSNHIPYNPAITSKVTITVK